MEVRVTQNQFAAIREARFRFDNTGAPGDAQNLIGLLALCCLENGVDYQPNLHRAGVPVKIVVIEPYTLNVRV